MLLTGRLVEVLDELLSAREKVGISQECPYIFVSGTAPDTAPLRGSDCVRLFAHKAGAKVTAALYRKHVATMLQLLQLSETEMDVVARFMGHDIRVHRHVYCMPERTTYAAAKISNILFAADQGIGEHTGRTLSERERIASSREASGTEDQESGDREGEKDVEMGEREGE